MLLSWAAVAHSLTSTCTPLAHSQLIKFSGVAAGEACTVVLRGATGQMIEEADRSLHDALSVLSQTVKETRVVLGGGCAEMTMAVAVDEEAKRTEGKKALAVEAFARALRQVRRAHGRAVLGFGRSGRGTADPEFLPRSPGAPRSRRSLPTTPGTTRATSWPSSARHITRGGKTPGWVRPVFSLPRSPPSPPLTVDGHAHRHDAGRGRVDEGVRRHRVVQAQAPGRPLGERGGRDDPPRRRQCVRLGPFLAALCSRLRSRAVRGSETSTADALSRSQSCGAHRGGAKGTERGRTEGDDGGSDDGINVCTRTGQPCKPSPIDESRWRRFLCSSPTRLSLGDLLCTGAALVALAERAGSDRLPAFSLAPLRKHRYAPLYCAPGRWSVLAPVPMAQRRGLLQLRKLDLVRQARMLLQVVPL